MTNTNFVKYQGKALLMRFTFVSDCEDTPQDVTNLELTLRVYDVLNNLVFEQSYPPLNPLLGAFQVIVTDPLPLGDLRFNLVMTDALTDEAVLFAENINTRQNEVDVKNKSSVLYKFGNAANAAPFYSGIISHVKR